MVRIQSLYVADSRRTMEEHWSIEQNIEGVVQAAIFSQREFYGEMNILLQRDDMTGWTVSREFPCVNPEKVWEICPPPRISRVSKYPALHQDPRILNVFRILQAIRLSSIEKGFHEITNRFRASPSIRRQA